MLPRSLILFRLPLSLCAQIKVPKTWDEAALAEWATPIAGLNVRPGHFSVEEYYRAPIDNLRTYPVYFPGREPEGYWKMLNSIGPKPLIETEALKTEADFIRTGKLVFEQYDVPGFRSNRPDIIAAARSKDELTKLGAHPLPDGTIEGYRWVVTREGVKLSLSNCSGCHVRYESDGSRIYGVPNASSGDGLTGLIAVFGASTFPLPGDSEAMAGWRSFYVPWIKDDIHDGIKKMTDEQAGKLFGSGAPPGVFPRWNGSPYYPTKIPDLIGIRERKYIDHTATHQHRGPADIMRYAALVTFSDTADFGPHRILLDSQRKIDLRLPDEALYALALYIYSLQPPPNPNRFDERAAAGQKIFARAGCGGCHTAPLYTNNKLTLATGFTPPKDLPKSLDVLPISVGTDSSLALKTRKATGFYKVPSLKGLWYRGHFMHDGSLTSVEEMFNPARLRNDFSPTGWNPQGVKARAVVGHEFGLTLKDNERTDLIAFLKTL